MSFISYPDMIEHTQVDVIHKGTIAIRHDEIAGCTHGTDSVFADAVALVFYPFKQVDATIDALR